MKNSIRNIFSGFILISLAMMSSAQAQIPVVSVLLSAAPSLSALDGLPIFGGGGDVLGAHGLDGIPVVGAVISGAALQGALPVLQTVLSPEYLADPAKVLMLLDPATQDTGSTLVFAAVGGVTTKLPLLELPSL